MDLVLNSCFSNKWSHAGGPEFQSLATLISDRFDSQTVAKSQELMRKGLALSDIVNFL